MRSRGRDMHRQARRRGRRIRDFKARTEFSVSFCSQCEYLWCINGNGPQRKYSSQITSFSMLQSLLKFTHVSYACTPLIILASENKGKFVSPICIKIMSISSHGCISFKAVCLNFPSHKNELEDHCFLNGICQHERTASPIAGDMQTSVSRCKGSPLRPLLCLQYNFMMCWRTEGSFLWS